MSYFKKILMPLFVITTFSLTANSMEPVSEDFSDSEEKIFSHKIIMSSGGGFPPPLNRDLMDINVNFPKFNTCSIHNIDIPNNFHIKLKKNYVLYVLHKQVENIMNNCFPNLPEKILNLIFDFLSDEEKEKTCLTCLQFAKTAGFVKVIPESSWDEDILNQKRLRYKEKKGSFLDYSVNFYKLSPFHDMQLFIPKTEEHYSNNYFSMVPDEIFNQIFGYLTIQEKSMSAPICVRFAKTGGYVIQKKHISPYYLQLFSKINALNLESLRAPNFTIEPQAIDLESLIFTSLESDPLEIEMKK